MCSKVLPLGLECCQNLPLVSFSEQWKLPSVVWQNYRFIGSMTVEYFLIAVFFYLVTLFSV